MCVMSSAISRFLEQLPASEFDSCVAFTDDTSSKSRLETHNIGDLMRKSQFTVLAAAMVMVCTCLPASAQENALWVDFNSTSQDNGPHNHPDYQPYDAGHEVADDFVTVEYEAFGATVGFTPSWPDTTDNRVMQAIDRGTQEGVDADGFQIVSSHDFFWFDEDVLSLEEDMTNNLNLVTDWIGADTRVNNGGNGDFDGDVGDPTRMLFTLTGIPAGEYNWVSFHHDTEWMHGRYWFDYSVDGGSTFQPVGDREFTISKSRPEGNPPSDEISSGFDEDFNPIDLKDLPSTVQFDFAATGEDVVMQFTPLSEIAVHTQFAVVNGFQLTQTSASAPPTTTDPTCVIPEGGLAGDLDGSGDVGFADFLLLSNNFGATDVSYGEGDIDCDGTVAFADFLALSNSFGQTAGTPAAVPEPSGMMLSGLALLFVGCLRRKR